MSRKIENIVSDITENIIREKGLEPAGVDFIKEKGKRFLRIYIYKKEGVSIDDCVTIHRAIEPLIDNITEIEGSYILEISSPGYDRPLKTETDFLRYTGEKISIKLYTPLNGKKVHEGWLKEYKDEVLILKTEDEIIEFNIKDTAKINRVFEF